ncbi:MAG: hypothetical protein IKQ71_03740 [Lachnospiraceae bacterium]|nr:hypothetical protein [Lachnospiraceae bacterium]
MKRIATHLFALLLLIGGFVLSSAVVDAATALTPTGGTGTTGDPYIGTISDFGTYSYSGSKEGLVYSITFAKDGMVKFSGGTIYKGLEGREYYGGSYEEVKANTPVIIRVAGSRSVEIAFEEANNYNTKESAYDLTNVTTAAPVSIPQGADPAEETWFRFTITAPSTIEFEPYNTSATFMFYKNDGTTPAVSDKNFYDGLSQQLNSNKEIPFSKLDANIFYPTNTTATSYQTEPGGEKMKDNKAKMSFYEAGTYYMFVRGGSIGKNMDRGFKSFILRPYKPITGLKFKQGNEIKVEEKGKNYTESNSIIGIVPEDADGFPKSAEVDTSKLSLDKDNPLTEVIFKDDNFGKFAVKIKDERGEVVDTWTVTNTPRPFVDYQGTGSSNAITVKSWSTNSDSKADSIRIYLKKGSKFVLAGTAKGSSITLKKLKANTKYQIKLTNYDSKSKAESKLSKAFTVGTAPAAKPTIKSVTNIKISKETGTLTYNPGKWNEYKKKYTFYAANGKITVAKVKGATSYEYNIYGTSCPNTTNKPSANFRLVKGGNTPASCKKTLNLKCRVTKKYSNTFTAYGSWGKAKKVKIK